MHQPSQELVPFKDQQILTFSSDGEFFVAVKPLCDTFQISWQSQNRKLRNDAIFNTVISFMVTTGADGKRYEMVCLPLEVFPMWLARIETRRVKNPQARDLILTYQKEATKVLYQHFLTSTPLSDRDKNIPPPSASPLLRGTDGVIQISLTEYIGLLKDKINALEKKKGKSSGQLTAAEKEEIFSLWKTGKYTYPEIAKMVNRGASSVWYIVNKYKNAEVIS